MMPSAYTPQLDKNKDMTTYSRVQLSLSVTPTVPARPGNKSLIRSL